MLQAWLIAVTMASSRPRLVRARVRLRVRAGVRVRVSG